MPVDIDEVYGPDSIRIALHNKGVTAERLADHIDKKLDEKKPFRKVVKGAVNTKDMPDGWKVVTTTGVIGYDQGSPYATGETLLEYLDDDSQIQHLTRVDAQKLLGLYPAEKHSLEPGDAFSALVKDVLKEIDGMGRGKLPSQEDD
jgi:hypothetical protein